MKRAWTQPLRHQLFYALVFLFVPMALAAGGLGWEEYRETVEELTATTQATALRSAAAIERELTGLDRMARNLLNNPVVQGLDPAAVEPAPSASAASASLSSRSRWSTSPAS